MSSQPKQKKRCPSCGSTNPASAASCEICGYVFDASSAGSSSRVATLFRPAPPKKPAQPVQHTPPPPAPPPVPASPPPSPAPRSEPSEAHTALVEDAAPLPDAGEAQRESSATAATEDRSAALAEETPTHAAHRSSGVSDSPMAASDAKVEAGFKPRSQAASSQASPRPAAARPRPAAPYKPKATSQKRPMALSTSRSRTRSALSLILILGTVLGVAALLAAAIAGSSSVNDSSVRPVMPTPIIATEQVPDALPAVVVTATEVAEPAATATSEPLPSPLPTDPPPPPTDTPAPQPTGDDASPTTAPASQSSAVTYTVKQGDSCWAIAGRFDVSVDDLIRQNNLTANCLIRPGQELVIRR